MWDYKIKVSISELTYSKDVEKITNDLRYCYSPEISGELIKQDISAWATPSGASLLEITEKDADIFIQKLILGDDSNEPDTLELQIANLSKSVRKGIKADQDITIYLGAGRFPDIELISVFTGKISKVRHDLNRPDVITSIWAQPAAFNLMRVQVPVTFSIPVGRRVAGHLVTYFELIETVLKKIFGAAIVLDKTNSSGELACIGVVCEIDSVWTIEKETSTRLVLQKIIEELAQVAGMPIKYSFAQSDPGRFKLILKSRKEPISQKYGYSISFENGLLSFETENEKEGDKFRSESLLLPKAFPQDKIIIDPNINDVDPRFGTNYLIEKVEHRIDTSFLATTTLTLSEI